MLAQPCFPSAKPFESPFFQSKENKVLLVCIYNIHDYLINHEFLYNLFNQYGEVLKILIFEKSKILKSFIEFREIPEAASAFKDLQGLSMFEENIKMNIYFAKMSQLKLNKNKNQGIDYEQLKQAPWEPPGLS